MSSQFEQSLAATVDSYYQNEAGLYVTELRRDPASTEVTENQVGPFNHTEILDPEQIDVRLHEVGNSLRVISHGNSNFEIATANDAATGPLMLHISTYSSALSINPGNAYEFAAQAARYPDNRHLYVGSFGNGSTSPLLDKDAKHVAKTGRFSVDDGQDVIPLESLANLNEALKAEGLNVTQILGTDSAGGHYARGLSLAMEPGELKKAYFSETSGFVDMSLPQITHSMLIKEGLKSAKLHRKLSPDPQRMDAEKVKHAKAILDLYAGGANMQRVRELQVTTKQKMGSMLTAAQALKRGPNGNSNPLLEDTNAMLGHHPDARIAHGMAEYDPLYKDPETAREAAARMLGALTVRNQAVTVFLVPGMTHTINTYYPSLYHALKRAALSR